MRNGRQGWVKENVMDMHVKKISRADQIPPQAQKVYKGDLSPCANNFCDFLVAVTGVDLREIKITQ